MTNGIALVAASNRDKAVRALNLIAASLNDYQAFNPTTNYTPKALEPYDAQAGRFVRAVECCLRYFRSYEMLEHGKQSETTCSLLNRMEKPGLAMRNVRNRIVHDYLPEQTDTKGATTPFVVYSSNAVHRDHRGKTMASPPVLHHCGTFNAL